MKKIILLVIILISQVSFSQNTNEKNSESLIINGSANKNIFIFFPSPIIQGTVGNNDFIFGFDRVKPSKIGILKSKVDAEETNLLVITEDQNIYSFILKYSNTDTENLNHFIELDNSIGSLSTKSKETKNPTEAEENTEVKKKSTEKNERSISNSDSIVLSPKQKELRETSKLVLEQKPFYKRFLNEENGIYLKLERISYKGDELYFTLAVENKSGIHYDISYLNFFIGFKKSHQRRALQKELIEPLYIERFKKRIETNESNSFVYVLPKFSLDHKKVLFIEMKEANGDRNLLLKVPDSDVNLE